MSKPPHQIEHMYVAIAVDKLTGDEGVCGMLTDAGWIPLVASDRIRLPTVLEAAEKVAKSGQMLVRVVRFEKAAEFRVFDYRPDEERN